MRSSLHIMCFLPLCMTVAFFSPASARADTCPETAQRFWKVFRAKALTKDAASLVRYVRFPFEVRGNLDSSEKKVLDRKEFIASYALLLRTDPGMSPEPTTMEAMLKKTTKVPKSACDEAGTEFRVGTWTFNFTPEGWLFVRAFVED